MPMNSKFALCGRGEKKIFLLCDVGKKIPKIKRDVFFVDDTIFFRFARHVHISNKPTMTFTSGSTLQHPPLGDDTHGSKQPQPVTIRISSI